MRLIDADALMPLLIEKVYTMDDKHGVKLGENWLLDYEDIKDVIDNAPTVERPQGEWIDDDNYYANCSCCGYQMDTHEEHGYFKFCPNCGAKMTKEAENEDY